MEICEEVVRDFDQLIVSTQLGHDQARSSKSDKLEAIKRIPLARTVVVGFCLPLTPKLLQEEAKSNVKND